MKNFIQQIAFFMRDGTENPLFVVFSQREFMRLR